MSPYSNWYPCVPIMNETGAFAGFYNCTWNSTNKREGNWSIQINATRTYLNSNSTVYTDRFFLDNIPANASVLSVDPAQD